MHGVGAADRVGGGLGEAEEPHLALLHELGHGADGLLDGDVRVHAVLVVEVDVLDPEPLQGGVACLAHVLGVAADAQPLATLAANVAELGGQHHVVAAAAYRPADQALVGERAVHVGRIEERDPELECPVDRGDRLLVVGLAVELGHAHATEALHRHLASLATESARLHHSCTTIFPRFSPRSRPINASGAWSRPSTTVSRCWIRPSRRRRPTSSWKAGMRSKWSETMNPLRVRRLP